MVGQVSSALALSVDSDETHEVRIISLSPHITELIYALGRGEYLVAASDYSDYPEAANKLPRVSNYQGANIAEILRLKPTHVVVWRGGNKDADIQKLQSLGINIYESKISSWQTLLADIQGLATFLDATEHGEALITDLHKTIAQLQSENNNRGSVLYYLNQQPLVGLGNDAWLNSLLSLCGLENVYKDSVSAYPQLKMSDVLRKQPNYVIAATKQGVQQVQQFWSPHQDFLNAKYLSVNPDAMHRFTPRAIAETARLCDQINVK